MSIAEIQEETTLTKIRLKLNEQTIKLWEPPYYDKEKKKGEEEKVHELAVILTLELEMPIPHIFQGLLMLQQNALERLAAKNKFEESGILNLRIRCAKGLKTRSRNIEVNSTDTGDMLVNKIGVMVDRNPAMLRLISGGRVIQADKQLKDQGVRFSSTMMVVLIASRESVQVVEEQRRLLEQTKQDAGRLGEREANKDDYYLQVADQTGRSLDLPVEERKAIIISMSLHEKGRAALAKADYSLALVLLLEAESEFSSVRSDLVSQVDNFAILNLDIAWCYLMLQSVSELPNAAKRLEVCEQKFKDSYGTNLDRLLTIKGSTGQEAALLMRLHLLQGIVAFHLGRENEARLLLKKVQIEAELLNVNEKFLDQIVEMGYTVQEARLGLRAARGSLELAVDHINTRREEKAEIRRKEQEDRELEKLREKLGKCGDGSWVNVGYYNTLVRMGFTEKVSCAALKQSNNSLNLAVQLLQEQPDLIELAAREDSEGVNEEDLAKLISIGYTPEMAKIALEREEGNLEDAANLLAANQGELVNLDIQADEAGRKGKRRRKDDKAEKADKEAYTRIKEGISKEEENHLDLDLKIEKEYLEKYLQLVNK